MCQLAFIQFLAPSNFLRIPFWREKEQHGEAEDVVVSENQVKDTVNDGIFLQRGDGTPIDTVSVSQNSIQNAVAPAYMRTAWRF